MSSTRALMAQLCSADAIRKHCLAGSWGLATQVVGSLEAWALLLQYNFSLRDCSLDHYL